MNRRHKLCPAGSSSEEDAAKVIWKKSGDTHALSNNGGWSWPKLGTKNCMKEWVEITTYTFWQIWKWRNEWQFNREECDPKSCQTMLLMS